MYELFSWFCFLQTTLLFSAYAQDISKEASTPPTQELQAPQKDNKETTTEKKSDLNDRFISHDEKPAIFGSHAYNPITQEFEVGIGFNETLAYNMSAFQHHSPHVPLNTAESSAGIDGSTKGLGRLGRFRGFKKLSLNPYRPSIQSRAIKSRLNDSLIGIDIFDNGTMANMNNNMPDLALKMGPDLNDSLNKV